MVRAITSPEESTPNKWMHGKRYVVEPARLLSVQELANRVCVALGCMQEEQLAMPVQAA